MYADFLYSSDELAPLLRSHDPALFHQAGPQRLLKMHAKHVAAQLHGKDVPPVAPLLMRRIGDSRTMRAAIDHLTRHGIKAPGPSQLRLEELSGSERWSLARVLAKSVRIGTYRPGDQRRVDIPKEGKPGESRTLTIQSVEDRVAGTAARFILEPLVDPTFSSFSFGFRPKLGRFEALAAMLALSERQKRWFVVCTDVKTAFDQIPHSRFLDACRRHFPEDVVDFIRLISCTQGKRGLPQGAPHSPFCANIFFDAFHDRPWHRPHPDQPLLRYADNLLMLCEKAEQARAALEELSQLACSAGTPLKQSATSICDLRGGQPLEWLGFLLRREGNLLAIRIGELAWEKLGWRFAKAHFAEGAPLRARQIAQGWIEQMGPCFAFEDRDAVLGRLQDIARQHAFDEIQGETELSQCWSAAHARWHRLYSREAGLLQSRLDSIQSLP